MTRCQSCLYNKATHDDLCGPCAVAELATELGRNEGHTYEAEPHMVNGVIDYYEVYEVGRNGRRFHCTLQEWPNSAAARRIGPVTRQDGLRATEGGV